MIFTARAMTAGIRGDSYLLHAKMLRLMVTIMRSKKAPVDAIRNSQHAFDRHGPHLAVKTEAEGCGAKIVRVEPPLPPVIVTPLDLVETEPPAPLAR